MLRIKLNKLKQVCATALLPKIFRESKYARKKIDVCPIEHLSKLRKSTDSGSKDEKYEKQMRIIEKCFAKRTQDIETKEFEDKEVLNEKNRSHNLCKGDTDKSTELVLEIREIDKGIKSEETVQEVKVQATTFKVEEEKLAQKLDHIDEVPHVEAGVPKIEGFNITPKVLGHENSNLKRNEQIHDFISDQNEQIDLDDLAKRCLGAPSGDYDHALLNELKNITQRDLHILNIDLSNNEAVEKYFSQILEKTTPKQSPKLNELSSDNIDANIEQIQKNLNEMKSFVDKEAQSERFQPLNLDTVPLFTVDNNEKDYDEDKCIEHLTLAANEVVFDIPAVLNPYDMQAMPFYNYINKETVENVPDEMFSETTHFPTMPILTIDCYGQGNKEAEFIEKCGLHSNDPIVETSTVLNPYDMQSIPFYEYDNKENFKDILEQEKITVTETIQRVTDIPLNEDTILEEDDLRAYDSLVDSKVQEVDCDDSQPPVKGAFKEKTEYSTITLDSSNLSESDVSKLLEYKNVLSVKPEHSNIENVLSFTTGDIQGDDPNIETQIRSEIPNSAISGTFPINNTKHTLEIPENTAISANQSPEEYYELPNIFKSFTGLSNEKSESLFCDYAVSQNMVFSTMPQFLEADEDSGKADNSVIKSEPLIFYPNGPFTHAIFRPEPYQEEVVNFEITVKSNVNDAGICPEDAIPLSLLWKRLRERNRSQLSKDVYYSQSKAKPVTGTCNRPLDKSKPKTTLQPDRCKPKPKPDCKPTPCPQPCPPKKDPCAKLIPFLLNTIINTDSSRDAMSPLKQDLYQKHSISSLALIIEGTIEKFKYLTQIIEFLIRKRKIDGVNEVVNVACAKNFEPWTPIPSWPIPKVEKKRPLVCPKDGCKLPTARPTPPNINKPCLGMPKKLSPTKTFCRSFANPY